MRRAMLPCRQERRGGSMPLRAATSARASAKIRMPTGQRSPGRPRRRGGGVEVGVRRAVLPAAGDGPAAEDVGLARTGARGSRRRARSRAPAAAGRRPPGRPRRRPGRPPRGRTAGADDDVPVDGLGPPGQRPPCCRGRTGRRRPGAGGRCGRPRGRRPPRSAGRPGARQGVGQQDVAEPGDGPVTPGVDERAAGVPDQDVGAAEPEPRRQSRSSRCAERARRQRAGRPGQPDEGRARGPGRRPHHRHQASWTAGRPRPSARQRRTRSWPRRETQRHRQRPAPAPGGPSGPGNRPRPAGRVGPDRSAASRPARRGTGPTRRQQLGRK